MELFNGDQLLMDEQATKPRHEELDVISYLSNPSVRTSLKNLIDDAPIYSQLSKDLIEFYISQDESYLPEDGVIRAYLQRKNYQPAEIERSVIKKNEYMNIGKKGVDKLIDGFLEFYKKGKILDIVGKFHSQKNIGDAQEAEDNLIKSISELNDLTCKYLDLIDLSEIDDPEKCVEEELGGTDSVITSKFDVVKRSCIFNGYTRGMLVQVNGPPGKGKTMFMMNELVHQLSNGHKVIWCAIGDMFKSDFLIRLTALICEVPQEVALRNLKKYYTDEVKNCLKNLRILIYPASEITAVVLANALLSINSNEFDYEIFYIDYDANLKETTDSMYLEGGHTYNAFSRVCRQEGRFKLGFVGSQVKPQYWSEEVLPEQCSAESSKKQAIIDAQININTNPDVDDVGTINIAKQRRGKLAKQKYKRSPHAEFIEIDYDEYQSIARSGGIAKSN